MTKPWNGLYGSGGSNGTIASNNGVFQSVQCILRAEDTGSLCNVLNHYATTDGTNTGSNTTVVFQTQLWDGSVGWAQMMGYATQDGTDQTVGHLTVTKILFESREAPDPNDPTTWKMGELTCPIKVGMGLSDQQHVRHDEPIPAELQVMVQERNDDPTNCPNGGGAGQYASKTFAYSGPASGTIASSSTPIEMSAGSLFGFVAFDTQRIANANGVTDSPLDAIKASDNARIYGNAGPPGSGREINTYH